MANDTAPIELARYRNGKELETKLKERLKAETTNPDLELAQVLAQVIQHWLDEE